LIIDNLDKEIGKILCQFIRMIINEHYGVFKINQYHKKLLE